MAMRFCLFHPGLFHLVMPWLLLVASSPFFLGCRTLDANSEMQASPQELKERDGILASIGQKTGFEIIIDTTSFSRITTEELREAARELDALRIDGKTLTRQNFPLLQYINVLAPSGGHPSRIPSLGAYYHPSTAKNPRGYQLKFQVVDARNQPLDLQKRLSQEYAQAVNSESIRVLGDDISIRIEPVIVSDFAAAKTKILALKPSLVKLKPFISEVRVYSGAKREDQRLGDSLYAAKGEVRATISYDIYLEQDIVNLQRFFNTELEKLTRLTQHLRNLSLQAPSMMLNTASEVAWLDLPEADYLNKFQLLGAQLKQAPDFVSKQRIYLTLQAGIGYWHWNGVGFVLPLSMLTASNFMDLYLPSIDLKAIPGSNPPAYSLAAEVAIKDDFMQINYCRVDPQRPATGGKLCKSDAPNYGVVTSATETKGKDHPAYTYQAQNLVLPAGSVMRFEFCDRLGEPLFFKDVKL